MKDTQWVHSVIRCKANSGDSQYNQDINLLFIKLHLLDPTAVFPVYDHLRKGTLSLVSIFFLTKNASRNAWQNRFHVMSFHVVVASWNVGVIQYSAIQARIQESLEKGWGTSCSWRGRGRKEYPHKSLQLNRDRSERPHHRAMPYRAEHQVMLQGSWALFVCAGVASFMFGGKHRTHGAATCSLMCFAQVFPTWTWSWWRRTTWATCWTGDWSVTRCRRRCRRWRRRATSVDGASRRTKSTTAYRYCVWI